MFYVVAVAMPVLFVYVWQKRKSKLILFGGIIFFSAHVKCPDRYRTGFREL